MKDTVVFTFGRFNPPTTGHEKLIEKVAAVAKKESADFMVFPSHSQNPKKDPLSHKDKISFMKKMFPKYSRNIINNKKAKTAIDIATMLYGMGYKSCTMVVGGDRLTEFKTLLNKYNSVEGKHGFYDFKDGINVVSAGERDPDAEGVTGMSASKMRAAAAANDYDSFKNGLPKKFEKTTGKKLFDVLRKSMNISEELATFLDSVNGDLLEFLETDFVECVDDADDNELYESVYKEFFAERKVAQDKDIEDRKGTQPKKYYAKDADGDEMSKSTKQARARHFAKYGKKSDDSDSSYKPAPGDANAKTKPSKYTKLYHKMYGEDVSQKQIDDLEKFADRMLAKHNIDITFTRHFVDRMNDKRNDPEIKVAELQKFFKKVQQKKGSQIKANPDIEAVLKDMSTNLNLPVVINYKNGEFEVVHKTIMRKKNFSTSSKELKYESSELEEARAKQAVSGGKVQKLVTAHGLKFKGKVYKEIDMELKSIDNNTQMVTFNIIHPKEIFGNEVKIPFKTLRRGPFMATDTSKINNEAVSPAQQAAIAIAKKNFSTSSKELKYEERDYKKEREQYHGTPEQMEKNRARKRARYAMEKAGKAKRGDGKDVHHKDNNPLNNDPKNLSLVSQHYNRKEPRMRKESPDYIEEISNMRRMKLVNKIKNSGVVKKGSMSKDDKKKDKQEGAGHSAAQRAAIAISKKEKAGKPGYDSEGKSLKKEADGCWNGYKQVGMKEKNGKMVPNCVPESVAEALASNQELMNKAALDALHKLIKSKGNKSSLKSYAFDIAKSFRGMKGRDLENLYKKSINANYKEETDLEEKKIDGLVKKADKSGISYGILKKVYDRGMAAWKTGHRPGTTPQQWAFARVNSFLTGGGARKADNDLWQKRK